MMTKLLSISLTMLQACAEFELNAAHSTMAMPSKFCWKLFGKAKKI